MDIGIKKSYPKKIYISIALIWYLLLVNFLPSIPDLTPAKVQLLSNSTNKVNYFTPEESMVAVKKKASYPFK